MLARSNRSAVPIRKTFAQRKTENGYVEGPLADLVRRKDDRGLQAYLLLHALASSPNPDTGRWDATLNSQTWGRALGLSRQQDNSAALSKVWRRLEKANLIGRQGGGRLATVYLKCEDGQGGDYSHPADHKERYFQLPHEFWTDGERWYETLSLAARGMLLIALSLTPKKRRKNWSGFVLPMERTPDWYGLSADSAQRGLAELRNCGLITWDRRYKRAPLAPLGFTEERHYFLERPFGPGLPLDDSKTGEGQGGGSP